MTITFLLVTIGDERFRSERFVPSSKLIDGHFIVANTTFHVPASNSISLNMFSSLNICWYDEAHAIHSIGIFQSEFLAQWFIRKSIQLAAPVRHQMMAQSVWLCVFFFRIPIFRFIKFYSGPVSVYREEYTASLCYSLLSIRNRTNQGTFRYTFVYSFNCFLCDENEEI